MRIIIRNVVIRLTVIIIISCMDGLCLDTFAVTKLVMKHLIFYSNPHRFDYWSLRCYLAIHMQYFSSAQEASRSTSALGPFLSGHHLS